MRPFLNRYGPRKPHLSLKGRSSESCNSAYRTIFVSGSKNRRAADGTVKTKTPSLFFQETGFNSKSQCLPFFGRFPVLLQNLNVRNQNHIEKSMSSRAICLREGRLGCAGYLGKI